MSLEQHSPLEQDQGISGDIAFGEIYIETWPEWQRYLSELSIYPMEKNCRLQINDMINLVRKH